MSGKQYKILGLAAAALLAVVMLAWAPWGSDSAGEPADRAASSASAASSGAGARWSLPGSPAGPASGAASGPFEAKPFNPLDHVALPAFRATAQGELQLDAQTRADVERIQGLYERDDALAKLKEAGEGLSPKAQRELHELYRQYVQYAQAVAQAFPPEQGGTSFDAAAQQLAGLHDLRAQYFGAERAEALFGEEEKVSRELLALMRQSKDPSLSLEEKAAMAQDAWKKNQGR